MTHAMNLKPIPSKGLRRFQKFIFIGNTSIDSLELPAGQLHSNPDSEVLSTISPGSSVLINQINATNDITRQLRDLSIKPGQTVKLISRTKNGSVVVSLGNKLIGIGAEIAQKIIITGASHAKK